MAVVPVDHREEANGWAPPWFWEWLLEKGRSIEQHAKPKGLINQKK